MKYIETTAAIDIPLDSCTVKKGEKITITKGRNETFALWHNTGIYDLPKEYVEPKDVMEEFLSETEFNNIKKPST